MVFLVNPDLGCIMIESLISEYSRYVSFGGPCVVLLVLIFHVRKGILSKSETQHIVVYLTISLALSVAYFFIGSERSLFSHFTTFTFVFCLMLVVCFVCLRVESFQEDIKSIIAKARYVGHGINLLLLVSLFFTRG